VSVLVRAVASIVSIEARCIMLPYIVSVLRCNDLYDKCVIDV